MDVWNEAIFDDRMDGLSASSVELLRQLLYPDPQLRMKSKDFVRHPWIQGITAASTMTMDPSSSHYMKKRFRKSILRRFFGSDDSSSISCDTSKLRDIFNAIDLEGNGVLDANEIRVALRSVGEPEDVISNIVASMDLQRNGGSVQGVSWETFQAIMNAKE
jgi:EF-hand domain